MRSNYVEERIPERKQRFAEAGFIHGRLGVSWLCCPSLGDSNAVMLQLNSCLQLDGAGCSLASSGMSCVLCKVFMQPCCALHAKAAVLAASIFSCT